MPKVSGSGWTEFALSTRDHLGDLQDLEAHIGEKHIGEQIRLVEGQADFATLSLLVDSRDFDRAKQEATNFITVNSLTIRIRANASALSYEVWQNGKKVKVESYVIEKGK